MKYLSKRRNNATKDTHVNLILAVSIAKVLEHFVFGDLVEHHHIIDSVFLTANNPSLLLVRLMVTITNNIQTKTKEGESVCEGVHELPSV